MRLEICAVFQKGKDYLTFDARLEVGVEAETALCLGAEINEAFRSVQKCKVQEKVGKGKGKARDEPLESSIMRDAPQHSSSGFCNHACGHGRNCHGGHYSQGNGSSGQGPGAHRRPGNCKAYGKTGH